MKPFISQRGKKALFFSERKAEVNYCPYKIFMSISRISLPAFPFELADKKLKSLLNMCAIVAIRHDKELKTYYTRKVEEGKAKMLVINNVRGKLLARAFAVINRNSPFINTFKFAS